MNKYIVIGAFVLAIAVGWLLKGQLDPTIVYPDKDSTVTVTITPQKPDSGRSPAFRIIENPKTKADAEKWKRLGLDSTPEEILKAFEELRAENDSLLMDRGGQIQSPALGVLDWLYSPTVKDLIWNHFPPDRIDSVLTVAIPVPADPGFFYNLGRWVEGAAVTALVFLILIFTGGI